MSFLKAGLYCSVFISIYCNLFGSCENSFGSYFVTVEHDYDHPRLYEKEDSAKGGLAQFLRLYTVISCAPKYLQCLQHWYLKAFASQIYYDIFSR